jgi:hypothetical protein
VQGTFAATIALAAGGLLVLASLGSGQQNQKSDGKDGKEFDNITDGKFAYLASGMGLGQVNLAEHASRRAASSDVRGGGRRRAWAT